MGKDKTETTPGLMGKLKTKLDRMLGRNAEESLDIEFKPQKDIPAARRAFRIDVDNMHVICRTPRVKCRILDISAGGIGFVSSKEFPVGTIVEAVLLWSGKPVLKNVKLKIARRTPKVVGCEFIELERSQDKVISKIVLAAQKRLIEKKHSGKHPDTTEEEMAKEIEAQKKRGITPASKKKIKL
ncbi:PilZ domain-containing protein [Maridesulfovibrio salexigens]|uniref:Type IV pilus assembly PilZ n=1 Tax=Maridesulfovibrio salexigens (strain ATCC 14822 / DSM 2638 / NCIMB 8403 / VKM B-1763) TaxID=526222 RepID=C6BYS4_MARSD|nr:PilZ domain-containing protein [Maridesulfovibrio salexigens]ACS80681.1 type IV pilus assembly PilZ [Maridesulfovibrio salexigens DSM 2638]